MNYNYLGKTSIKVSEFWGDDQPRLTIQEKTPEKTNKKAKKDKKEDLKPEAIEQILAEFALAKRGSLWNEQDLDE